MEKPYKFIFKCVPIVKLLNPSCPYVSVRAFIGSFLHVGNANSKSHVLARLIDLYSKTAENQAYIA